MGKKEGVHVLGNENANSWRWDLATEPPERFASNAEDAQNIYGYNVLVADARRECGDSYEAVLETTGLLKPKR